MSQSQDPTPEQIAERSAEIRRGWTPDERMKRLRVDLRPSFVRADGVRETMDADDYDGHHERRGELQEAADDG